MFVVKAGKAGVQVKVLIIIYRAFHILGQNISLIYSSAAALL